jgi:pimeloyl-ACP methyl ester carboxylesterase
MEQPTATNLFHKEYGDGHPLIILHGLLGASGNWHTLSRNVFSDHFRVLAVDQRNHGRSFHADRHDYSVMAEDLWHFLGELRIDSTYLMGHSMGGKTAMYAALAFPKRIDKLIVVDMAPKPYPPHHASIIEALHNLDPSTYDDRSAIDRALAESVPSDRMRQFLLKNLDYDGEQYTWKMNLDAIAAHYDKINQGVDTDRTYDKPTLFIRGETSDYIADDDEPAIRANFPQAEIVTINGAGHWVHADAPEAFAETVMDFLTA